MRSWKISPALRIDYQDWPKLNKGFQAQPDKPRASFWRHRRISRPASSSCRQARPWPGLCQSPSAATTKSRKSDGTNMPNSRGAAWHFSLSSPRFDSQHFQEFFLDAAEIYWCHCREKQLLEVAGIEPRPTGLSITPWPLVPKPCNQITVSLINFTKSGLIDSWSKLFSPT